MKSILVIAILVTTAEKVCGGGEERQQLDFSQCCESTVSSVFVSNSSSKESVGYEINHIFKDWLSCKTVQTVLSEKTNWKKGRQFGSGIKK